MDKVNSPSMTMNVSLSEEKYRKSIAAKPKDSAEDSKNKQQKAHSTLVYFNYQDLLHKVGEVNAYLSSAGQNILVLIHNNESQISINILDTRNHDVITNISVVAFFEMAHNLLNNKLTTIERDV